MTENLKNDFLQKIEWRFYSYLVQYQLAKYDDDIIGQEVSANHNSVAYLSTLRVDRIAREKKKALLKAEIEYTKSISNELNQKVAEKEIILAVRNQIPRLYQFLFWFQKLKLSKNQNFVQSNFACETVS